jgi:hypothetical protein
MYRGFCSRECYTQYVHDEVVDTVSHDPVWNGLRWVNWITWSRSMGQCPHCFGELRDVSGRVRAQTVLIRSITVDTEAA